MDDRNVGDVERRRQILDRVLAGDPERNLRCDAAPVEHVFEEAAALADARLLADAVIRDGFARVRLAPESPTPPALYAAAGAFFARPDKWNFEWAARSDPDTRSGYRSTPFREFYELHPAHAPGAPPPPPLADVAAAWCAMCRRLSCALLDELARRGLCPPSAELLRDADASMLRVYRYRCGPLWRALRMRIGVGSHVDLGLVTVAPCGSRSGLELRPNGRREYVAVEPQMGRDEVVVFFGSTLTWLSGGAVACAPHRVVRRTNEPPRFSAPYFLRPAADSDAAHRFMLHVRTRRRRKQAGLLGVVLGARTPRPEPPPARAYA